MNPAFEIAPRNPLDNPDFARKGQGELRTLPPDKFQKQLEARMNQLDCCAVAVYVIHHSLRNS